MEFQNGNKYTNLAILTENLDYEDENKEGDFDTWVDWSIMGKLQNPNGFTLRSQTGQHYSISVGGDIDEDWNDDYLYQYILHDIVIDNVCLVGYGAEGTSIVGDDMPAYALFATGQRLIIGANVDCLNKVNIYGGYYDEGDADNVFFPNEDHVESFDRTDVRIFSGDYHQLLGGSHHNDGIVSTCIMIAGNGVTVTDGIYGGNYQGDGDDGVGTSNIVIAGEMDNVLDVLTYGPHDVPTYTQTTTEGCNEVFGSSRDGEVGTAMITLTNLATATSVQGDGGSRESRTDITSITLTGTAEVTGSVLGKGNGDESSTITVVGTGGPASVSAGTVGNASALVLGGSSVLTVGDITSIGSLTSYSSGTTPATDGDCSDPSVRNEVVMPHTMVLRIGDDRTGGPVYGYTLLTPSGGSFDGVLATGSASTDDQTSGFMLADGRVKASVQTIGQLKHWGAVRFLSESVTLTFSSETGTADAEVTFQLRDGETLRHTGVNGTLRIVDGTAFDQHGTAGTSGAFLDMHVSDAGQTASGFDVVTHTYSDGWVEDVRTYDGELGGSLSVSSGLLNPEEVEPGDAGSVILSFDVVSGGITVGYAELEIAVVVLPSLSDGPGVVVYVVTVGQDAFGTTVDVELGGLGPGTTFSTTVDDRTVSVTYDHADGLDIPSSLEGTGLIGLSSEDGVSVLLLIAIGSLDDVPAAGVLTL